MNSFDGGLTANSVLNPWANNQRGVVIMCNGCPIDEQARCIGALNEAIDALAREVAAIQAAVKQIKKELSLEFGD